VKVDAQDPDGNDDREDNAYEFRRNVANDDHAHGAFRPFSVASLRSLHPLGGLVSMGHVGFIDKDPIAP
jgi:hypothetical protein